MPPQTGSELWDLHIGRSTGLLTQLVDLDQPTVKTREIEKKYRLPSGQDEVGQAISSLFAKIGGFVASEKLQVVDLITFVGIDMYYVLTSGDKEFVFRYRSGANRPPQLTVKYQLQKNSNIARGEINLDVASANPNMVVAFMSAVVALQPQAQICFTVQQSGEIWVIKDPVSGKKVEIVVYRTKRLNPHRIDAAFVEIEPLKYEEVDEALMAIERYERGLGLNDLICSLSIAEMFRPGNEHLLGGEKK